MSKVQETLEEHLLTARGHRHRHARGGGELGCTGMVHVLRVRACAPEHLLAYWGGVRSTQVELVHFLDVAPAKWAQGLFRGAAGSAASRGGLQGM